MFDKLMEAGSTFDWITPLSTLIQDFRNRPAVGYNIAVDGGWSAYAISDLLQAHGIKLWGLTIFQGTIMLRVRAAQAEYAQYLFAQNGIAFSGGVDATKRGRGQRRRGRTPIPAPAPGKQAPAPATVRSEEAANPNSRTGLDGRLSGSLEGINRFVDKLPGR